MTPLLSIGTRGSPLALTQARMVASALAQAHGWDETAIAIVPIRTTGDRVQDRPLAELGGKALWTKELDTALYDGRIDIAVHSMKDVETIRPDALSIAAMLPREDVRDRLIGAASIEELPHGAHVGTSSPRRAAQLLHLRPDLKVSSIRGNVAKRIERLEAGEFDATLLAAAGLRRLGHDELGATIAIEQMLPAVSQGAVGIETLTSNETVRSLMAAISDAPTFAAVSAERAMLAALGGTCYSPVAALARVEAGTMILRGEILLPDGSEKVADQIAIAPGDREAPALLAQRLLGQGSAALRSLFEGQ